MLKNIHILNFLKIKIKDKKIMTKKKQLMEFMQNEIPNANIQLTQKKMTEEINEILNKYLKKVYQKDTKSVRISIDVNPNNMS